MNKKPVEKYDGSDKSYEIDKSCCEYIRGYNQCLKEVREYMPSVDELERILEDKFYCERPHSTGRCLASVEDIAKAIKERIEV